MTLEDRMIEIIEKLERIIELLEDATDLEPYPITGSVSWTGLDDWQECDCGQLVPPDGHCNCK